MRCPRCGEEVPNHVDRCPVCGHDVGFPNVRAAEDPKERQALDGRHRAAQSHATAHGCKRVLDQFEDAVRSSKAVYCCAWGVATPVFESDNELFTTYHERVRMGARLPEDNEYDPKRTGVDGTLFPDYYDKIHFMALTLDDHGASGYGDCTCVMRTDTIADRASVFEENSFYFCRQPGILTGGPLPPGHRATWDQRHRLATAKLYLNIDGKTRARDFPGILFTHRGSKERDEYIEVHVYGPLHRKTVEKLVVRKPKTKADQVIVRRLRRKLAKVGVKVVVT